MAPTAASMAAALVAFVLAAPGAAVSLRNGSALVAAASAPNNTSAQAASASASGQATLGNVYEKSSGVGAWGGTCTCPDGQSYHVGDKKDGCGSLACYGGTPGPCNKVEGDKRDGMQVTCAPRPGVPTPKTVPDFEKALAKASEASAAKGSISPSVSISAAATQSSGEAAEKMAITAHHFMEVDLGPFASAAAACDYCFGSFTKEGQSPAGPIAPACVCMAYPDGAQYNMFCATPVSAAGYVAGKGGCRCKGRDMENMGSTTCEPIR